MSDEGAFDLSLGRAGAGPLVTQASLLQNMEYLSRMGLSLPLAAQNKARAHCSLLTRLMFIVNQWNEQ